MHTLAKAFGMMCGLVVTAISARYGLKTSDNDFDGAIWAFTYGSGVIAKPLERLFSPPVPSH
jgi:hypothetical protein